MQKKAENVRIEFKSWRNDRNNENIYVISYLLLLKI